MAKAALTTVGIWHLINFIMPDGNAERAWLKEHFVAGEIGTSTKEELERYLLVLVCSTPPDALQKQHDLENEAFSQNIK